MRVLALLVTVVISVALSGCLDQFNPFPTLKKFREERVQSIQPTPKLSETGELETGGKVVSVAETYAQFCANCHGATGHGDGPAGLAMNPKPRNLTDAAWRATVDDARITKVLKEGGTSVGLSAMMAPWGSVLSDDQIKAMVAFIFSLPK